MTHLNLKLTGKVQGVGFRYFTRLKAQELGLTGFVRNEPDGSVYIEVEGEAAKLTEFIAWCHEGTPSSEVIQVEQKTGNLQHYTEFTVAT